MPSINQVIHKIVFNPRSTLTASFYLPKKAKLLSVQEQWKEISMWVAFDPEDQVDTLYNFRCVETGRTTELHESMRYAGTVQLLNGEEDWHVYTDMPAP